MGLTIAPVARAVYWSTNTFALHFGKSEHSGLDIRGNQPQTLFYPVPRVKPYIRKIEITLGWFDNHEREWITTISTGGYCLHEVRYIKLFVDMKNIQLRKPDDRLYWAKRVKSLINEDIHFSCAGEVIVVSLPNEARRVVAEVHDYVKRRFIFTGNGIRGAKLGRN
jgi:hypothetical protein